MLYGWECEIVDAFFFDDHNSQSTWDRAMYDAPRMLFSRWAFLRHRHKLIN